MSHHRIESIIRITADHFGLGTEEILGRSRQAGPSAARQSAMRLARDEGFTLSQLATAFGRDQSTVSHACQRVAREVVMTVGDWQGFCDLAVRWWRQKQDARYRVETARVEEES